MMMLRDITMDDIKEVKLEMEGSSSMSLLDVLAATAERAKEIYDAAYQSTLTTQTHPKKRKRTTRDNNAPKRRRYNTQLEQHHQPQPQPQPQPLPEEFKRAIEEMARARNATATEAVLVIQKSLSHTDLSRSHNRLSIPVSQIVSRSFLTEEEDGYIKGKTGDNMNYKEVTILEPCMATEKVKFCRWEMRKKNTNKPTSSIYVINGKWYDIVRRNNLMPEMLVQLWSFRIDQDLCFALVRL